MFREFSHRFWMHNEFGGRFGELGWAANTVAVLLLILAFQLAVKTRFWLGFQSSSSSSSFFRNIWFRSISVVSLFTPATGNDSKTSDFTRSSCPSKSTEPQIRISEIISDLDLKSLIDNLDENSHEYQKWDNVIDRQNTLLAYSAKCCRPKDGPLKYLSLTTFENCSAEVLRDFYMDNNYRKKWDKTLIGHEQLQVDESNGTEIGHTIKKFPLLTAREYVLAWRMWEAKDGTFYCFTKECDHPLVQRQKKYVRVEFFRSGWRIRKVPGRNACEIKMVHQEDAGLNVGVAKLAFAKGIWSYVCKMDDALRKYSATNYPQSCFRMVPVGFDTVTNNVSGGGPASNIIRRRCSNSRMEMETETEGEGNEKEKFSKKFIIGNGIIFLGGLICVSRAPSSSFGAKLAMAYILTKLTKRCAPASKP
ncbi:uncharacterized protein LOC127794228 isoform X2 [Diospyros lotus]|uniref:uncharacterized protein LOC127794228 isoform X2 n=1 Tax=Diospyros lotus TaxID=55363 RepID=UPI0022542484|nr:uncharacterized protein LOC127794228 isoform X2 [Diospyros lotus]